MKQGIDHSPAIPGLALAGTGMHTHPRRLVYDRDTLVFINHVEGNVFSKSLERRQFNSAGNDDFFSSTQPHGRLGHIPIEENLFLLDELLHAYAVYVWKLGDEPLVQSGA